MDAEQILGMLAAADVVEQVHGVTSREELTVLYGAERRTRFRPDVLDAITERSAQLGGGDVIVALSTAEAEVESLVKSLAMSRPSAQPLRTSLALDDPYPVPAPERFEDPRTGRWWTFMEAPDLDEIAQRLMREFPTELRMAQPFDVKFLWRAKGSKVKGQPVWATTQLTGGLNAYFAGTDFIILVAADSVGSHSFTFDQVRALVFHELKHIGVDPDSYRPKTVGHDVEMFYDELRHFPRWRDALKPIDLQRELPGFES